MPAMEIIATQGKVVVLNHDKGTRSVTQEADPMQVGAHFPPVTPACNSHLHFPREADPMKVGVMDFMGEGARCLLPAGTSCLTSHQLLSLPYLLPPPLPVQVVVPDNSCCLGRAHTYRSHLSHLPTGSRGPQSCLAPRAARGSASGLHRRLGRVRRLRHGPLRLLRQGICRTRPAAHY